MTVRVRGFRSGDAAAVRDVLTAAFGDRGEVAGLADALRARRDGQRSLVAVTENDEPIGYVHLSVSWVDAPSRVVEVLTLSPVGVAPAHQGNGVGSALVRAAIDAAEELGAPMVFLEGNPAYYGWFGWRTAEDLGFARPSARIPVPGFQVVLLSAFDPATMTGPAILNDTFWSLDFVGLRA